MLKTDLEFKLLIPTLILTLILRIYIKATTFERQKMIFIKGWCEYKDSFYIKTQKEYPTILKVWKPKWPFSNYSKNLFLSLAINSIDIQLQQVYSMKMDNIYKWNLLTLLRVLRTINRNGTK